MTLASNIREARQIKNISQGELAEILHVHQTYISQIERGLNVPSVELLDRMADVFDCSVDRLLGRDPKYFTKERNDLHNE